MEGDLAQIAAMVAVGIVAAIIGVIKYVKGETKTEAKSIVSNTEPVIAASFLDSRLLRELVDGLNAFTEEFSREGRKMNRTRQELTTALEESTDAVLSNSDAIINMVRFLRRQETKGVGDDKLE